MCGVNSLIKHSLSTEQALPREDRLNEAWPCREARWLAPGPVGPGLHPFSLTASLPVSPASARLGPLCSLCLAGVVLLLPPLSTAAELGAPHPPQALSPFPQLRELRPPVPLLRGRPASSGMNLCLATSAPPAAPEKPAGSPQLSPPAGSQACLPSLHFWVLL